jgi:hypothetical protein
MECAQVMPVVAPAVAPANATAAGSVHGAGQAQAHMVAELLAAQKQLVLMARKLQDAERRLAAACQRGRAVSCACVGGSPAAAQLGMGADEGTAARGEPARAAGEDTAAAIAAAADAGGVAVEPLCSALPKQRTVRNGHGGG